MNKPISNQEPKGTQDWLPAEFAVRKYIFDTWRQVCLRYGFEEYLTPLVENAEIYRAKSGEDVGGPELLTFSDLGGRELAIRPEMTPSVVRLLTKVYAASPKPIKLFSIANFMRNEKPQRGRNREFWQLNCDIFGSNNLSADLELLQLALDLVLEFDPPQNSFFLGINNRKLLEAIFDLCQPEGLAPEQRVKVGRILDKWNKLTQEEIKVRLGELDLDSEAIDILLKFMTSTSLDELLQEFPVLKTNQGLLEIAGLIEKLEELGYGDLIEFKPAIIRGFDYYDGLVFEVYDNHPDNRRAMFGGGRYNGLAEIFGEKNFPALGFAPGDETFKLFLESWGLLAGLDLIQPDVYYLPLLDKSLQMTIQRLAKEWRSRGHQVYLGLEEQKIAKALELANKKNFSKVIIVGPEEATKGVYKIKDMTSGEEKQRSF
ncbi:MAG: histidine--tRNA ligase [Patescibacteria group bacterium]|jgi:histidyl-tRNA synthetase